MPGLSCRTQSIIRTGLLAVNRMGGLKSLFVKEASGISGDLPKLLKASGVRAKLTSDAIPVSDDVKALFPDDWLHFATRGGEDYQLLFTAPSSTCRRPSDLDSSGCGTRKAMWRSCHPREA